MSAQQSFSRIENELLHQYRPGVAAAATQEEVRQQFARAVCTLLEQAGNGGIRCRHEDVELLPEATPAWRLSPALTAQEAFAAVARDSDLNAILARLAEQAVHRCAHLAKHREKTNTNQWHRH